MKVNAVFKRKDPEIETTPCFIEAIESMGKEEFSYFKKNLLQDCDFIKNNIANMYHDKNGVCHCILALCEDSGDGILINSSGSSYARYTCFMPCIKPYIDQQLLVFADSIITKAIFDDIKEFDLEKESNEFGLAVRENNGVSEMLFKALSSFDEIYSYDLKGNRLSVKPNDDLTFENGNKKITEACNSNPWLRNYNDYPLSGYPYTFERIMSAEDLKLALEHGNMAIRTCYLYEDLAFVQQVNGGDEWLTLKKENGNYKDFESISFRGIIQRDGDAGFYACLDRLLTNSIKQYMKQEETQDQNFSNEMEMKM